MSLYGFFNKNAPAIRQQGKILTSKPTGDPAEYGLYNELIEFLAGGPKPQDTIAFQPSEQATTCVNELLDKNRAGTLTPVGLAELDQYETLDYLMPLVKARARLHLTQAA